MRVVSALKGDSSRLWKEGLGFEVAVVPKKGNGLDCMCLTMFLKTYFGHKRVYMRFMEVPLRKIPPEITSPIDWGGSRPILKDRSDFRQLSDVSPLNHIISSPGASENQRGTCGNISWIYGLSPVHSSPRITSCFLTCVWSCFGYLLGHLFGLKLVFRPNSGNCPN